MQLEKEKPIDWFYEKDGKKVGPIILEELELLVNNGIINRETLFWHQSLKKSIKFSNTNLYEFTDDSISFEKKPLNNSFIWLLAFSPILGTILFSITKTNSIYYWILLYFSLAFIDYFKTNNSGYKSNNIIWVIIFIPAYLWKRGSLTDKNRAYFWTFLITLLFAIPFRFSNLELLNLSNGTTIESVENRANNEEPIALKKYYMNQAVIFDNYQITVINLIENLQVPYDYKPENGNKYVAVEVEYQNISKESISYNSLYDWKLFDNNSYSYSSTIGVKKPDIDSGTINPSGKVRGWLTFEVLDSAQEYYIHFSPIEYSGSVLEIILRNQN